MTVIGVLSDTHGTLHEAVVPAFQDAGVVAILHAGDVGDYSIIRLLEQVAPVTAVRGNIDVSGPSAKLPMQVELEVEGTRIYMTHIGGKPDSWLRLLPTPKPHVAICGHSHAALRRQLDGVLFLNPGAAGKRPRFGRPLTFALLRLDSTGASAEIITLR
ncbi:MAG: metallophosphatase family protein [Chloroflexota bacterium]|nr:metallophosphatase family protein [Chloroflexota bacterium]